MRPTARRDGKAKQSRRCGWNSKEENQAGLVLLIFLPAVTRRPLYTCQASSLIYELWPYNTCASVTAPRCFGISFVWPTTAEFVISWTPGWIFRCVESNFVYSSAWLDCDIKWRSSTIRKQSQWVRKSLGSSFSLSKVQWKMENRNRDLIWTWIRIQESFNFE